MMRAKPTYNACVRIAIDVDLFRVLAASESINATKLAAAVGMQEDLLGQADYPPDRYELNVNSSADESTLWHGFCPGNRQSSLWAKPCH
jgi:hypothetical protein